MKLQKSGLVLTVLLLSTGAGMVGSDMRRLGLTPPPPAHDAQNFEVDIELFNWLKKHAKNIASNIGPDISFDHIRNYADRHNLGLPHNLSESAKTYILASVQAASEPYHEWMQGFDVVASEDRRMDVAEVLQEAQKEMNDPDIVKLADYVQQHNVRIDSFDQLSNAFENSGIGWDDEIVDRTKLTDVEKENWVRIYKKVFELLNQRKPRSAKSSKNVFKVVEVVDLAKNLQRASTRSGVLRREQEQERDRVNAERERRNRLQMQRRDLDRTYNTH
ncbi:MAG TPA: hypothetical protein VLG50_03100 [Candidatus Saccharimonadales bacterium]|nr:hypothetical protein [Candidatus Saccharimonadales bacterium]